MRGLPGFQVAPDGREAPEVIDNLLHVPDQIIDLYANGLKNVHVYSMNKPDVAEKIMGNLSDILGK